MSSDYELAIRFRTHLALLGFEPRPGVSEETLNVFELENDLRLPVDFRAYLRVMDGTADYGDDLFSCFASISELSRIQTGRESPQSSDYLMFADQMLSAPCFVIDVHSDKSTIMRYWDVNSEWERACDSFSQFMELFMEDPWKVHV